MPNRKITLSQKKWRLPFGFFAGPVLWGLQILVGYGLVAVSCTTGNKLPVYMTIAFSGLIVLAAAILTYQSWNATANDSLLIAANQAQESAPFWVVSGFVMNVLFFILILVTVVAAFFLSPCPIITMPMP
jgi:small-conductance mechanosensitive channel